MRIKRCWAMTIYDRGEESRNETSGISSCWSFELSLFHRSSTRVFLAWNVVIRSFKVTSREQIGKKDFAIESQLSSSLPICPFFINTYKSSVIKISYVYIPHNFFYQFFACNIFVVDLNFDQISPLNYVPQFDRMNFRVHIFFDHSRIVIN